MQMDPGQLPQSVQASVQNVMKALVFLCQKSIVVRLKKQEKEQQCEEDNIAEGDVIIEDEENECDLLSDDLDDEDDEDYDCNEDMDRDLYDSKLDDIDEVLFTKDIIAGLEQNNP